MIIKKITYESLIDDRKLLHKLLEDKKKDKEDKRNAELEKLPDMPRHFKCTNCNGSGYNKKKFKSFKKIYLHPDKTEYIMEEVICVDCLEKIMKENCIHDNNDY